MESDVSFGQLLQQYRVAAHLTQESLAERAGMSPASIAALERGRRTSPRAETVKVLVDALELDAEQLARLVEAARKGQVAPPPASPAMPSRPRDRVPSPLTPVIGREHEEAAVTSLLHRGHRLVSLLGPGGVGKTSLALQVAAGLQEDYTDGAMFVDLSPLRDPALVAFTIARATGVQEIGTRNERDPLIDALQDKQLLLVLDNFEQVISAASLLSELLEACPRLSLLVTSRVALSVRAEQRFQVEPLGVPHGTWTSLTELSGYPAVQLFVSRARAVQPGFDLVPANAEAVADICRRLDGLPLALELAAAGTRLMPLKSLAARLRHPLSALGQGARDLPSRQQTLRATLEWSYGLLPEEAQRMFLRLGVFAGGCDLDAVEAVCDRDGTLGGIDTLGVLIESNMVVQNEHHGEPRFGLLETLREYALEYLESSGDLPSVRRAHAGYYAAAVEASRATLRADTTAWLDRWELEHDNLRAALMWTLDSHEREVGLRLAAVIWRLWLLRGYLTEGRTWLDALLEGGQGTPQIRAQALRGAATLAGEQGDFRAARRRHDEALALFRQLGDEDGATDILVGMANHLRDQKEYGQATKLYEEAMAILRRLGDSVGVAVCLNNLGTTAHYSGDLDRAVTLFEEGLALRRPSGDLPGVAYTLNNLADVLVVQGELIRAIDLYEEALAIRRDLGDKQGTARALVGLGNVARRQGEADRSEDYYREALNLGLSAGHDRWIALALMGLAEVALLRGNAEDAARSLAAIDARQRGNRRSLYPVDRDAYDAAVERVREAVPAGIFKKSWLEGAAMPLDDVADLSRERIFFAPPLG